jgi:tRNA-dihydrouridine synthase B
MKNFWLTFKRPILALAPMEGVTDMAFRTLCHEQGADVVYTEFMAAEAIIHGGPSVLKKLRFSEQERPAVCQIFGTSPEAFAAAAKQVQDLGYDGLDLNFGCPARKVVRRGAGVALLREPSYARQLIEAVLGTITIPLSIKVRSSIRKEAKDVTQTEERSTALDLVRAIHDLPVSAIMIHGRNFEQGHSGEIDTAMIKAVKAEFPGLVLANGGITNPESAVAMLQATGADGVGIARGTWGQPWIFRQTRQLLETGSYDAVTGEHVLTAIRRHAELLFGSKDAHGLLEFRKHCGRYISGFPGAAALRARAVRVESLADVNALVDDLAHHRR